MKRFEFSLERVLKHKQQRERLAKVHQHQALAALRACEEQRDALAKQLDEAAAVLRNRLGKALDVGTWLATYQHSEHLGRVLLDAEHQVRQAAIRHEQARQVRRQARIEMETLERLRHRKEQEHRLAQAKAERLLLDEIGLRRWQEQGE